MVLNLFRSNQVQPASTSPISIKVLVKDLSTIDQYSSTIGKVNIAKLSNWKSLKIALTPSRFSSYIKMNLQGKNTLVKIADIATRLGISQADVRSLAQAREGASSIRDYLECDDNLRQQLGMGIEEISQKLSVTKGEILTHVRENGIDSIENLTCSVLSKKVQKVASIFIIPPKMSSQYKILEKAKVVIINPFDEEGWEMYSPSRDEGSYVAEGTAAKVFRLGEICIRVHTCDLDESEYLKKEAQVEKEQKFLTKLHGEASSVIGIQEKIHLKKVQVFYLSPEGYVEKSPEGLSIVKVKFYNKGDLREIGGISKENAFQIQRELAQGYGHAHSNGIAHLDGKLDNYLCEEVNRSVHAVIGDWGGAIEIDLDSLEPLPLEIAYTQQYTSKEDVEIYQELAKVTNILIQRSGSKEDIQAKKKECLKLLQAIDMYQFGVSLYQMAVQNPNSFPQELEGDAVKRALEDFYGKNSPKVECILQMLSKSPNERPLASKVREIFSAS